MFVYAFAPGISTGGAETVHAYMLGSGGGFVRKTVPL